MYSMLLVSWVQLVVASVDDSSLDVLILASDNLLQLLDEVEQ